MICFEHFRTLFLNVHVEIVGDNGMSWDNPLRFGDLPSNSGTIGWVKSQTKKLGHWMVVGDWYRLSPWETTGFGSCLFFWATSPVLSIMFQQGCSCRPFQPVPARGRGWPCTKFHALLTHINIGHELAWPIYGQTRIHSPGSVIRFSFKPSTYSKGGAVFSLRVSKTCRSLPSLSRLRMSATWKLSATSCCFLSHEPRSWWGFEGFQGQFTASGDLNERKVAKITQNLSGWCVAKICARTLLKQNTPISSCKAGANSANISLLLQKPLVKPRTTQS